MTNRAPAAVPADRGDLKSTAYEFFMLEMATVGVALFATFSGFLANAFLSPRKPQPKETTADVAELEALLDQQEETTRQLRAKLEQLQQVEHVG